MKKENLLFVSVGFALFSMFFGSGNLVFPLKVGVESGDNFFAASLGVLCTAVLFPLLGMLGMLLYKGNLGDFFALFGKRGTFLFSLVALGLMGPFGVLARCLTVMHGALHPLLPDLPLVTVSLVSCGLIYLLSVNKSRIVHVVGSVLTPFLLLSIACIVFYGLQFHDSVQVAPSSPFTAFTNGFFTGYQTMDLVASFFFSGFVLSQLKEENSGKLFLKSACLGALLLYLVYLALVLLGELYAKELSSLAAEEMFGKVAVLALGTFGAFVVSVAVVLACLTTAIALTSLFAEFVHKEVLKQKVSHHVALGATVATAFFVSTFEFSGIARFLGPVLETVYPALIVLTLYNIAKAFYKRRAHA